MKNFLYLLFIVFFASFISCKQQQPSQHPNKAPMTQKIQRSFFGMTLGKTKLTEGEDILLKTGVNYQVIDGFGEIALTVTSPMTFSEIQWDNEQFIFTNNVLYQVSFIIDSASVNYPQEKRVEIYKNLLSKLKKKYPKYKITNEKVTDTEIDTDFYASDKWCYVDLSYTNDHSGIILMYSINEDKVKKMIPSEL